MEVAQCLSLFNISHSSPFFPPVPAIGEVRDKPIVTYVGDDGMISCKMDDPERKPISWNWYRANGTDKVRELLSMWCAL